METLDLLKLDMVNFTISHIRPHIQQHSVEYEKGKFKEILQSLSGNCILYIFKIYQIFFLHLLKA